MLWVAWWGAQAAERVHTVEHLEEQLGVVLKPRVQHAIQNETITALQARPRASLPRTHRKDAGII